MTQFIIDCYLAFEKGTLKVIIDKEFDMTDLPAAMKVVSNNQAIGKIIVKNNL